MTEESIAAIALPAVQPLVIDTVKAVQDGNEVIGYLINGDTTVSENFNVQHMEQVSQWIAEGGHVESDEEPMEVLRSAVAASIRAEFKRVARLPVSANGTAWNGGMDSALAIDGAVRLAEQMGQTSIDLFDAANETHSVSMEAGRTIAAAVGSDYQLKLARKQQLLRAIATADAEQLAALVWVD